MRNSGQKTTPKQPKMAISAGMKAFDQISLKYASMCTNLTLFIYWTEPIQKTIKKCKEFIKILTLISLKNNLQNTIRVGISTCLWWYIYRKYCKCGKRGGALRPMQGCSSLVSQYHNTDVWTCLKLMMIAWTHKIDGNTLSWHMVNASFWKNIL